MKISEQCLPCLVSQVIKVANITGAQDRDSLYRKVFSYMGSLDFSATSPQVVGNTFRMLKEHTGNPDPYKALRRKYNEMFLKTAAELDARTESIEDAVKLAILGNIVDFGPMHENVEQDAQALFEKADSLSLFVDDRAQLVKELESAKSLLYLGDNCGEICLDMLLIKRIRENYPALKIYFAVRGEAIINDNIEEDAYFVGMDRYAEIISNGGYYPGTELDHAGEAFLSVYKNADIIISKGQGNFESLSEREENIYFMLMTKCPTIAKRAGTPEKALICRKNRRK